MLETEAINWHCYCSTSRILGAAMVDAMAESGAAEFYGLVVLTVFLASLTPVVVVRLGQGRFTRGFWFMCVTWVGGGAWWKALHPGAVAWANASATFDPYGILGVRDGANATVVKKAYRALSREHHPDKGGDAGRFQELAQAYAALGGDATARRNYQVHGHPDGPRTFVAGIALPRGSEGLTLGLYGLVLALAVVPVACLVKGAGGARRGRGELPKKATILELRDALAAPASRPSSVSGWLRLLGACLDEHEGLELPPGPTETDAALGKAVAAMDALGAAQRVKASGRVGNG